MPEKQEGSDQQNAGCQACGDGAVAQKQCFWRQRMAPADAGNDPIAHVRECIWALSHAEVWARRHGWARRDIWAAPSARCWE
jgi:hypothetical protein